MNNITNKVTIINNKNNEWIEWDFSLYLEMIK